MSLLQPSRGKPITLKLRRDLRRTLKRGHPWVFADNLRDRPSAAPGTPAILLDARGREVARGFYTPDTPLAFRVGTVNEGERLNERWAERQMSRALSLRNMLFDPTVTTGFRLFNGEGDGLPGLVVDVYAKIAVVRLDGEGASRFWDSQGIAQWVAQRLSLTCVYSRQRVKGQPQGKAIVGKLPSQPLTFLENGVTFAVDVVAGQKTGFFLDQRDNRQRIRQVSAGKRLLNLFGYTGGFSVYGGLGGAVDVTTVDVARPAVEAAQQNWRLNGLPQQRHTATAQDAFAFLTEAQTTNQTWDVVVIDPPSFAPSQDAVGKALAAYQKLVTAGATVTQVDGLLAMSSCSSHVTLDDFLTACEEGISKARRRATVLQISGQPADHPTPLVFSEFRYLKFALLRVE